MAEKLTQKTKIALPWETISLDELGLSSGEAFAFYKSNLEDPVPILIGIVGERGLYSGLANSKDDLKLYRDAKPFTPDPFEERMLDARWIIRIEPFTGNVLLPGMFTYPPHYTVDYAWVGKETILSALNEDPLRDTRAIDHINLIRHHIRNSAGR